MGIISWRYGVLLELGPLARDYTLDSSSHSNYQLPITSQLHKGMKFHASICYDLSLHGSCAHCHKFCIFICAVVSGRHSFPLVIQNSWLLYSVFPIFQNVPEASGRGNMVKCSFSAEHYIVSYSHHLGQWWTSVLNIIDYEYKFPWWGLSDAAIYEDKL